MKCPFFDLIQVYNTAGLMKARWSTFAFDERADFWQKYKFYHEQNNYDILTKYGVCDIMIIEAVP